MAHVSETGLARVLSEVSYVDTVDRLAMQFYVQTVTLRLRNVGHIDQLALCGHARRSYLGALGRAASSSARQKLPCPWDPPCALDVFRREQLRTRGDGLPKPYLLFATAQGADMLLHLRVFGMANDWFPSAIDGLIVGLREILPWQKLDRNIRACPQLVDRFIRVEETVETRQASSLRLSLNNVEITDSDPLNEPHKLMGRLMRRVDGVSRWCGVALDPETTWRLTQQFAEFDYGVIGGSTRVYFSPNAKGQARKKTLFSGTIEVIGDVTVLRTLAFLGQLSHLGRGVVEGLGRVEVDAISSA